MRRRTRAWTFVLSFLAVAIISLVLTGCGNNGEQAKPEHPTTTEHPSGEHPSGEHPKSEHPK